MTERAFLLPTLLSLAVAVIAWRAESNLLLVVALAIWVACAAVFVAVGQRAARLARGLATETDPAKLEAALDDASPVVREAAAFRLGGIWSPAQVVERARGLLAEKSTSAIDRVAQLARGAGEARALDVGLPVALLLLEIAADPGASSLARLEAQDVLEDVPAPREKVVAAARERLAAMALPTIELVSVLGAWGEPSDATSLASYLAAESFPVASAACSAIESLLERGKPADVAPLTTALLAAREKLRAVHPPRDNPLADELVERIEDLETELGGAA